VFYREIKPDDAPQLFEGTAGDEASRRFVAKASRVFNADQVEGWSPPGLVEASQPVEILSKVETFIKMTEAKIRHGGSVACYRPALDQISVPPREVFIGSPTSTPTETYYATLLHELVHWTGAKHRLDRTFGTKFGDGAYAAEELVAEIGAAFLCADLQVANEPRPDHAAYLSRWLEIMKADTRAIFTASRLANEASDFLFELSSPAFAGEP
jgi:antirestriction protein ArdC